MEKKIVLMLLAVSLMAGSAMAGTVDVFGYTWTTGDDGIGTYTVNSPTSLTMSANGTGWAGIWFYNDNAGDSGLNLNVGDVLSYDHYIEGAANLPNPGFNSTPLNDAGSSLVATFESSYRNVAPDPYLPDKWQYINALGGWNDISPGSQATGLHFEFTFIDAQQVSVEVTDIVTSNVVLSGTGWTFDDSSVLGDIGGWYMYVGSTDNDVLIENFAITPEPATMALLGLGGLFLRRRRG